MPPPMPSIEVYKFGGASLADADAVQRALDIISATRKTRLVTVVSALAGVTDALLGLARRAESGHDATLEVDVAALHARHRAIVEAVVRDARDRDAALAVLDEDFTELRMLLHGVASLRELTLRTTDYIVARGEQMSARLIVAGLRSRGLDATYVEAGELIRTNGVFGGAFPDLPVTDRIVRARLLALLRKRTLPVVPGFVGGGPNGTIVTLGRGGSDLTASVIGRALRAERISLWKDVPGLMTTDPRLVPTARIIPQLNVREAAELAYYGAKVLHPRALIPLAGRRVPVFIRPFGDPEAAGTEISTRRTLRRYPVKALSVVTGQALVTVTGNGMLGVPGIAARTFGALHGAGISVALISQSSSEHSICLCVPGSRAKEAQQELEAAFAMEMTRGELEGVTVQSDMSMLAVVGLGMAGTVGIAARLFRALSQAHVNIVAIAQGSSELNISVVISDAMAATAAQAAHEAFQLDKIGGGGRQDEERLDVVLFGVGQIGRELMKMLPRAKSRTASRARPTVVGLIDRSGYVFVPDGISARNLAMYATAKAAGQSLASQRGAVSATATEAVVHIAGHALSRPVLVDLTADETMPVLRTALSSGMDVVLANKRPLAAPLDDVHALRELAAELGRRILHETTVGAGLPIMDSYAKLVETGDVVLRIEGCTSGTLGFLLTEIGNGQPFSVALRDAMARGFTEPDPRDDLSGMDVARKALILARMMGFRGNMDDVTVESMVPKEWQSVSRDAFLHSLDEQDAYWAGLHAAADRRDRVLRYVLRVTARRVVVGLQAVPRTHPLASLRGTDNQLVFTTRRYRENPLVISGPGAGPTVTAAGVLNDLLQLAAT